MILSYNNMVINPLFRQVIYFPTESRNDSDGRPEHFWQRKSFRCCIKSNLTLYKLCAGNMGSVSLNTIKQIMRAMVNSSGFDRSLSKVRTYASRQ